MLNRIVERRSRIKPYTETEVDIIRSATRLFIQEGYSRTTFKMLEADSGIKVGNITYHFHSKEDLLMVLVEIIMDYHADFLDDMNKKADDALLAYAMEITVQIAICENNPKAWELYHSAYSLPQTYEHIKRWATEKNYNIFKDRLPHWAEHDFRDIEAVASGIEFAALKTFCDRTLDLDKKVSIILDSMMALYEVPKPERKEIIEKILATDYEKTAEEVFDNFIKRLINDTKK